LKGLTGISVTLPAVLALVLTPRSDTPIIDLPKLVRRTHVTHVPIADKRAVDCSGCLVTSLGTRWCRNRNGCIAIEMRFMIRELRISLQCQL